MYVPMMAFFASISDPAIGGTYMTLLNTISNLGGNWPQTMSLWFVDHLSMSGCLGDDGVCHSSTFRVCFSFSASDVVICVRKDVKLIEVIETLLNKITMMFYLRSNYDD